MNTKAQGLSMNTIVIAAIAMLVLVVVSIIFIQQMGWFNVRSKDCQTVGGECQPGNCAEGYALHPRGACFDASGEKDASLACCSKLE